MYMYNENDPGHQQNTITLVISTRLIVYTPTTNKQQTAVFINAPTLV
jgi:hypothetical protein